MRRASSDGTGLHHYLLRPIFTAVITHHHNFAKRSYHMITTKHTHTFALNFICKQPQIIWTYFNIYCYTKGCASLAVKLQNVLTFLPMTLNVVSSKEVKLKAVNFQKMLPLNNVLTMFVFLNTTKKESSNERGHQFIQIPNQFLDSALKLSHLSLPA